MNEYNLPQDLQGIWQVISQEIKNLTLEWKKLFNNSHIWWYGLDETWKEVFRKNVKMKGLNPDEEELRQVVFLQKLDCSESPIVNLEPLKHLKYLLELDISSTNVIHLDALKGQQYLLNLNCFNTHVSSLAPLKYVKNLRTLHCNMTDVDSLAPLQYLPHLQELNINETYVKTLRPLRNLQKLKTIFCDSTKIPERSLKRFQRKHPNIAVIYTPSPKSDSNTFC